MKMILLFVIVGGISVDIGDLFSHIVFHQFGHVI